MVVQALDVPDAAARSENCDVNCLTRSKNLVAMKHSLYLDRKKYNKKKLCRYFCYFHVKKPKKTPAAGIMGP